MSIAPSSRDLGTFQWIEMAVFNAASFSGGSAYNIMNGPSQYTYFTGTGFQYPIKSLKFYNASNVGINLSYGQNSSGLNIPNDFLPPGATLILDIQTNHADNSAYGAGTLTGGQGQIIWGNAPAGAGNIYISGYL